MIIKNLKTGKDVTSYYLQYMSNEITKDEFERLSGLEAKDLKIKIKK